MGWKYRFGDPSLAVVFKATTLDENTKGASVDIEEVQVRGEHQCLGGWVGTGGGHLGGIHYSMRREKPGEGAILEARRKEW